MISIILLVIGVLLVIAFFIMAKARIKYIFERISFKKTVLVLVAGLIMIAISAMIYLLPRGDSWLIVKPSEDIETPDAHEQIDSDEEVTDEKPGEKPHNENKPMVSISDEKTIKITVRENNIFIDDQEIQDYDSFYMSINNIDFAGRNVILADDYAEASTYHKVENALIDKGVSLRWERE